MDGWREEARKGGVRGRRERGEDALSREEQIVVLRPNLA